MTAKQYLQQIYKLNQQVERLKIQRDQLRSEMFALECLTDDESMVKLRLKIGKVEAETIDKIAELIEYQEKIISEIEGLEYEQYKDILYRRYVAMDRWEKIAVDMNVSLRHLYRLHGQALEVFRKDVIECH